jgi:5-methylcytosine-specific restriction endonuclease McrA
MAKDGFDWRCKGCQKKAKADYYSKNKKEINERNRKWAGNNRELAYKLSRAWALKNKEQTSFLQKRWLLKNKKIWRSYVNQWMKDDYKKNPGKYKSWSANRRAMIIQRTPVWSDLNKLREVFDGCPASLHVDHIVALKARTKIILNDGSSYLIEASGLHVPWNLQYLTQPANSRKSNKLITLK